MFYYTVRCTFSGEQAPAISEQWIEWLKDEHIADVIAGGASGADIVKMDDGTDEDAESKLTYEIRYRFSDRAAFETYEQDHAPRLRDEGLRKFPLESGLSYSRSTGEVVYLC